MPNSRSLCSTRSRRSMITCLPLWSILEIWHCSTTHIIHLFL